MRFRDYIWLFIILVLLALFGYEYFIREPVFTTIIKQDTVLIRDTIRVVGKGKIVYLTKIRAIKDTIYLRDTLKFYSCIDTVIKKVGMNVCYEHPKNEFSIQVSFKPDTIRTITVIEKPLIKYEQSKTNFWADVAKVGGGVVIGFLLGRAK